MRKLLLGLLFLLLNVSVGYCITCSTPSSSYTYVSGQVILPNQVQTNENNLYTYVQSGVCNYQAGSITTAAISSTAGITYSQLNLSASIQPTDMATGNFALPSGAVFFMVTGNCPTGTTDVSGTYANKFVKINSTPGTSSAGVFTATTDGHTLQVSEVPALTTTFPIAGGAGSSYTLLPNQQSGTTTINTNGGGGSHSHTISSATTNEPSSITMKACQIN